MCSILFIHECVPVQTFQWFRTEQDISAVDCLDTTFERTGLTEMDERQDYTDKSQPIREHDCTICMTSHEICPEGAILIESDNQEWHKKADGTYVLMKSTFVNPHAHDWGIFSFFIFIINRF